MIFVSSAESPRSRNTPLGNTSSSSESTRRPSPAVVDGKEAHLAIYPREESSQNFEERQQSAVLARVKEELENWEKLVFSFDMGRGGDAEGNDRSAGGSNTGNSGRPRRNTTTGSDRNIDQQETSGDSLESILSGMQFSPTGGQPQQQQISQLAHLAQLAQLSQLNAQYNLGFDLSTLNQLAAMNMPPSNPHPDDAAAQALRQLQAQGMFPGANPDASNAVPTFPFPQLPAQPQSHQQPYMQAAQSQGLQGFPWPQTPPLGAPPYGQNNPGGPLQQRPPPPFLSPLTFPPSSGVYNYSSSPSSSNAAAGPSSTRQSASGSRATSSSPASPQDGDFDDVLVQEDKRRRNTAASARFRIKKKHKVISLEKSVEELEGRAEDLEREAADLRRENGWLKEMLIMKGRRARGLDPALKTGENDEDDSEDEEAGDGSRKDDVDEEKQGNQESRTKSDSKGKGKAKDPS